MINKYASAGVLLFASTQGYASCLSESTAKWDDGISDAKTIAEVAAAECSEKYAHASVDAKNDSERARLSRVYEMALKINVQMAVRDVLSYRKETKFSAGGR